VNSGKESSQFRRLRLQGDEPPRRQQIAILCGFESPERFVGLLQYPSDLINPTGFAPSATGSAVTRRRCGCGSQDLACDHFSFGIAGQRVRHLHYPEGQTAFVLALSSSRFIRESCKQAPYL